MKSKYSQVLKIKEQKVSDIEIKLFNARANKTSLENALFNLKEQISHEEFPKSGDFAVLQMALSTHTAIKDEIELTKEKIAMANTNILSLESSYKLAYTECEKMRYLHNEEIKKILKKIAHKQQNELDELAVMGHFRRNKNEDFI